jgi:SAM-dependent methyltransferase
MEPAVPNAARMYDYYLGGRESRPVDQVAAERVLFAAPQVRLAVRENRGFLERAVTFLAGHGLDQFLDIGSGLPTQRNVHQILAEVSPGARVVYVDYDPAVVQRSQELLTGIDTALCVCGDVRQSALLCDDPQVRANIDFDRPVAVLLVAVLNFVRPEDEPAAIIRQLRRLLSPGSMLAFSHGTRDQEDPRTADDIERIYRLASGQSVLRSRAEVLDLLDGCELCPPGLVYAAQWSADTDTPLGDPGTAMTLAAVARL